MQFGVYLVRQGVISAEQFVDAVEQQLSQRLAFGELAFKTRMLSVHQLFAVLNDQVESNEAFGCIAVRLGYLSQDDVAKLLRLQIDVGPTLESTLVDIGAIDLATANYELKRFRRTLLENNCSAPVACANG